MSGKADPGRERELAQALDLDERFFLRIAVGAGLLSSEAAAEAAAVRADFAARGRPKAVWSILLDAGLLRAPDVDRVQAAQAATQIARLDALYAVAARRRGAVAPIDLARALADQRAGRYRSRLGTLLRERGQIAAAAHAEVLAEVRRALEAGEETYVAALARRPRLAPAPQEGLLSIRLDVTQAGGAAPDLAPPPPATAPTPAPSLEEEDDLWASSEALLLSVDGDSRDLRDSVAGVALEGAGAEDWLGLSSGEKRPATGDASDDALLESAMRVMAPEVRRAAAPLRRRDRESVEQEIRALPPLPGKVRAAIAAGLLGAAVVVAVVVVGSERRDPRVRAADALGAAARPLDATAPTPATTTPAPALAALPAPAPAPSTVPVPATPVAPPAAPPFPPGTAPSRAFTLSQAAEARGRLEEALAGYRATRDAVEEGSGLRRLLDRQIASCEAALATEHRALDRAWDDAVAALRASRVDAARGHLETLVRRRPSARAEAALAFVRSLGDAVYVPAGAYEAGSDEPDLPFAAPAHATATAAFFIDRCETTGAEWRAFVEATRARRPAAWAEEGEPFPEEAGRLAVAGVTWLEADAYARWRGRRLPSEEEWERAARGTDRRAFPWGEDPEGAAANTSGAPSPDGLPAGPWPVGRAAGDVSPAGCADMGGNVAEWTASPFVAYPGSALPGASFSAALRVVRGGSWLSARARARCAARDGASVAVPYPEIGVRLAADVPDVLAELR